MVAIDDCELEKRDARKCNPEKCKDFFWCLKQKEEKTK